MPKSVPISISEEFLKIKCLKNRTPNTTDEEGKGSFALLSSYRDGGVYIAYYSGFSEWEKHSQGDEFVQILGGNTTLVLLEESQEQRNVLSKGHMLVIPKGVWHRFESPEGVKVMTITPQPTEHSVGYPKENFNNERDVR